MGRTKKPKNNDIPTISISGSDVASGAPTTTKCPVTFQAKVKKTNLTNDTVPVHLDIKGTNVFIFISGTEIGKLTSTQAKMVIECSELGVRYRGRISIKNDLVYAHFQRSR